MLSIPLKPLEKIPFKFSYMFTCDERYCRGHKLICVDWELGQAYRRWKQKYGDDCEGKIIERFETDMILTHDTHFFVGTIHGHPGAWIIVGLFYPLWSVRCKRKEEVYSDAKHLLSNPTVATYDQTIR